MTLRKWVDLKDVGWHSILLGNGASIAVDPCFSYSSLLEKAKEQGLVSREVELLFDSFSTVDFELILRMLNHAARINGLLGVRDESTQRAYDCLRVALIEAVRKVHIKHESASSKLDAAGAFLSRFSTIISLNYDAFVYWSMLAWNDEHGPWFKDAFLRGGSFERNWEYLRRPKKPAVGASLVFYPHGHLTLAASASGEERKIVSNESDSLLDAVFARWQSGDWTPLFVSEGTTEQKRASIDRSPYLMAIYEKLLPTLGPHLVIYGWSMSEQDSHLLKIILSGTQVERLAISVRPGEQSSARIREFEERVREFSTNKKLQINFFDDTSRGCWIHE